MLELFFTLVTNALSFKSSENEAYVIRSIAVKFSLQLTLETTFLLNFAEHLTCTIARNGKGETNWIKHELVQSRLTKWIKN